MSFRLDPYKGWDNERLKRRCGELVHALDRWQKVSLILVEGGISSLPDDMRDDLLRLRAAYSNDD